MRMKARVVRATAWHNGVQADGRTHLRLPCVRECHHASVAAERAWQQAFSSAMRFSD